MSLRDRMAQQAQQEFKLEFISEVSPQKSFIGYNKSVPCRGYAIITNSYTQEETRYDVFQCITEEYYYDSDYGTHYYRISDYDNKRLIEQLIELIFKLDEQGWNVDHVAQHMVNYRGSLNVSMNNDGTQRHRSIWKNTHFAFTINHR